MSESLTNDDRVACSLCEDEGEVSPCDMDADELYDCPVCLRAEGIALRAECATKAMEIGRLRDDVRRLNGVVEQLQNACRRYESLTALKEVSP